MKSFLLSGLLILAAAPGAAQTGSQAHSDPGHCHTEPRFHINAYGFHRHDGSTCKPVPMRPRYGAPSPDDYCITIGVARFCDK
jgi:hypothetical protein